jgi:hypothetical protein
MRMALGREQGLEETTAPVIALIAPRRRPES